MFSNIKSPFNQTYHCELNLSELEQEILFGKKQEASSTSGFKFLTTKLAAFAKERGIVVVDWIQKNNESVQLKANLEKDFITRAVGAGKVWTYFPSGLIDEQGLIKNQRPDHYFSVAQIAGWAVERGLDVKINDYEDADLIITLKDGSTIAIEYQTSLLGNNTPERIMTKWKNNTNKYGKLLFVTDSAGLKEIRSIVKQDAIVILRGTKLEEELLRITSINPNQN